MRIYNIYIFSLVIAGGIANAVMAFLRQDNIEFYFFVNISVFLVISLLYVHLNHRARSALTVIGGVLFSGFAVIILLKVIDILLVR